MNNILHCLISSPAVDYNSAAARYSMISRTRSKLFVLLNLSFGLIVLLLLSAWATKVDSHELVQEKNLDEPYQQKEENPFQTYEKKKIANKDEMTHTVANGETIYSVVAQHDITVSDIIKFNDLKSPYELTEGQVLQLTSTNLPDTSNKLDIRKKIKHKDIENNTTNEQTEAIEESIAEEPKKITNSNIPNKNKVDIVAAERTNFRWPVKGDISSTFGVHENGIKNDGINVLAPMDTPIHAAANGKVVYSGNELSGYGNLVIIKHKDGWLTAYAHQKSLEVAKGEVIEAGQIIGHVGQTGSVNAPQLHFALRKGNKAVDPLQYLPK
jgi:murein DD-endopeptidase MepM/ murein hydrolase activator NlpD